MNEPSDTKGRHLPTSVDVSDQPKVVHGMKLSQSRAFVVSALDDKVVPATRVFALLSDLAARVEERDADCVALMDERDAIRLQRDRLREGLEEMCDEFGASWDDLPSTVRAALKETTE